MYSLRVFFVERRESGTKMDILDYVHFSICEGKYVKKTCVRLTW